MNRKIKGFSPVALQKLILYSWPGNIRELENVVECAVAMANQDVITEDLILKTQKSESDRLKTFKDAKEDFEKKYLTQLIEVTEGNISKAAKMANVFILFLLK